MLSDLLFNNVRAGGCSSRRESEYGKNLKALMFVGWRYCFSFKVGGERFNV